MSESKREIAIVGAFDRANYGDILMPIIFDRYFHAEHPDIFEKYAFRFYGLSRSDMSAHRGYNTLPLADIYAGSLTDYAIVIGGDVLPCRYGNMYVHLADSPKKERLRHFLDTCFRPIFERYAKRKSGCRQVRPWILDFEHLGIRVIYNTIGGILTTRKLLFKKKRITRALNYSDYISVRDKGTKERLNHLGIACELFPDSVVLISEYISKKDFDANVSRAITQQIDKMGRYIVIQMSKAASRGEIERVAHEIERVYEKTGLGCVLLPIGRASGHSDQIPLAKLQKLVKTPTFLPETSNIYEIAYIIKNSELFCGTSLHGVVTSISYEIPHFALTDKITKLTRFIETWRTSQVVYADSNKILDSYEKLLSDKNLKANLARKRQALITQARENYEHIYEIIAGGKNV